MNPTNPNLKNALQGGVILSAAAAWVAVLILALSGWQKWSVWVIFLVLLIAITLTVCALALRRMLFQPMEELNDLISNWRDTSPEDLEKQINAIPGPMGDLGEVFYGQMAAAERRMAGIENTTAERTTQTVQLQVTEDICRSVLPQTLKDYPSRQYFEIAGLVSPGQRKCCTFYDYFYIDPGMLCVSIGQVPDQGIHAALLMATAQTLIRSRIHLGRSIEETMNDVNTQLYDYGTKNEVRALLGTLDTGMGFFNYVNTGVCAPILMRNGERFERVDSVISTPLARNQNVSYRAEELRLRQGDRLFLCTEGLVEAQDQNGSFFGEQALRETLNRTRAQKEPSDSLRYVMSEVAAFCPWDDSHDGYSALLLDYRKPEKELAHRRVPGTSAYAGEILDFLKTRLDENGISRRHYARIAVLLDELFSLCCRKQEGSGELVVECGVAPDAQSVTLRISGQFHGENPLTEDEGAVYHGADYIQNHGDFISFKPGEEQDTISVVCFL